MSDGSHSIALLSVNTRTEERTELHFEETELVLGRSRENAIIILSGAVARRHARLTERDGRLWLQDLGSTNGTYVEGERIKDTVIEVGRSFVIDQMTYTLIAHDPLIDPRFEEIERAFLDPIRRDPEDEATREVYSDFLEESHASLRAEWLRVELACRRAFNPTEREHYRDRLFALAERLKAAPLWRMFVARPHIEGCTRSECTARWEELAPWKNQTGSSSPYVRVCERCAKAVTYRDAYEWARFGYPTPRMSRVSQQEDDMLIAVDHLVTRGV